MKTECKRLFVTAIGINNEGIENKSEYKRILNKWSQGDFSTADEDHNKVWNMLGGTVGRTTGISSKEEEQAYLDNAN